MVPQPRLELGRLRSKRSMLPLHHCGVMEPRVGIEPTVAFAAGLQNRSFTIQGIEAYTIYSRLYIVVNVFNTKISSCF